MTINDIIASIEQSIQRLVAQSAFVDRLNEEPISAGDNVVVNNSFVYRDVKTVKSEKYLALSVDDQKALQPRASIATGLRINLDLKRLGKKSQNFTLMPLEDAVKDEIAHLGELLFILIGEIEDATVLTQEVDHSEFESLIWDPAAAQSVTLDGKRIIVGDTYDEEPLSQAISDHYQAIGKEIPDCLLDALGVALDKLQDGATARLLLPTAGGTIGPGITDSIIEVLKEQRSQYATSLARIGGDPKDEAAAMNEILRIAYNFASDATTYLSLIVSVCDLKPIVLWGTIAEHFALSEAFKRLPWTRSRNKPSLKNYTLTISDARNSAFHNLFPFRKSLNLALPQSALQDAQLRIFSEHTKKKDNKLNYMDRELVDILLEFTRARERRVPPRFWRQNLAVMDATIDLFLQTSRVLKSLHEVRG